mgnify:CR=1 FL=1
MQKVKLTVSKEAIDQLAKIGYSKEFGARPVKREIQHYVLTPLSVEILKHPEKKQFKLSLKDEKFLIS